MDGTHASPEQLVADPRLLRRFKSPRSIAAEAVLDLGDCLYFYAGLAWPGFGDIAFVYDPIISERWAGGATPFDTGGIIGYIRADGLPSDLTEEQRGTAGPLTPRQVDTYRRYVTTYRVNLHEWCAEFERFLDAHYARYEAGERAAAYVRGERPAGEDPTNRHRDNTDRRAWTWEIQAHQDHPALAGLKLLRMTSEKRRMFLAALEGRPDDPWWTVLDDRSIFESCQETETGQSDISKSVERAILSWL